MKILILGSSGFISCHYQEYFKEKSIDFLTISFRDYILSKYNCSLASALFNASIDEIMPTLISDKSNYIYKNTVKIIDGFVDTVNSIIKTNNIDCILNCIGYTGVPNIDEIGVSPVALVKNFALNEILPMLISRRIEKTKIAHISTGCIYYSYTKKTKGWTEVDVPDLKNSRMSYYSAAKYSGELAIAVNKNAKAFRLRIPFNASTHSKNYLVKILKYKNLLSMRNSLSSIDSFISATTHLIQHDAPSGVYNVTNDGSVTARDIVRMMKKFGIVDSKRKFHYYDDYNEFMVKEKIVEPRSNCVLNSKKISSITPDLMPHVQYELERYIKSMSAQ